MASKLPPPAWADADPEALRRALAEARAGSELPGPGAFDYIADLARWLRERIFGALERVAWAGLPTFERILIFMALGGALLAALAVLAVAVRQWRRRRAKRQAPVAVPLPAAPTLPTGDAGWWQREVQRRLAAGSLRPALEAAWWWTARRLDPPGLDASWTSGDLLRSLRWRSESGAAALRTPLRRLDRQLWSDGALRRDEVEAVIADLAGAAP